MKFLKALRGAARKPKPQDDVVPNTSDFLQPLYFVLHPDGMYSIAEPQPKLSSSSNESLDQLTFLLSQAPMLNAPVDSIDAGRVVAQFAYLNPATFNAMRVAPPADASRMTTVRFGKTVWVLTPLMPNGLVIYSPNKMPGLGSGKL